jgi:hypothetical protein
MVVVSPTLSKAGRLFSQPPSQRQISGGQSIDQLTKKNGGVQDVRDEMRENADAAFLAVSEEAPSNNQEELDEL